MHGEGVYCMAKAVVDTTKIKNVDPGPKQASR